MNDYGDFNHNVMTWDEEREAPKETLVEQNMRLAFYVAHRWRRCGLAFEDVQQEALLGLLVAAEKFDPEKGTRFSTMAVPWIEHHVRRAAAKIKVVDRAINDRGEDKARPETVPVATTEEPGFIDPPSHYPAPDDAAEERLMHEAMWKRIDALDARDREILCRYYGLDGFKAQSQKQIAESLGLSRQRVTQLMNSIESRLQD